MLIHFVYVYMRMYVYVGVFVHKQFVYIYIYIYMCVCVCVCVYVCLHICMYERKYIYVYMYVYPAHYKNHSHTSARWCTGQASSRQVYLQSTAWVERLLQEVTFLWHLVRGNCVWGAFLTPNSPLSHPSSATSLYFGHKYFAKSINSQAMVEALYTYQIPFNHQIKGWLQHLLMTPESGGPTRKATGEC